MFDSPGGLAADPAAALLFPDFAFPDLAFPDLATGAALHLSGTAVVEVGRPPHDRRRFLSDPCATVSP